MEEKKEDKKFGLIVILMVLAFIPVIIIIGLYSDIFKSIEETNHESQLIKEGKTKNSEEVINEIIEILKEKDKDKLNEYLADEFIYYDNNNNEYKYLDSFFRELSIFISNYEVEQRGNDIEGKETYRIYWNVVEENKNKGVKRGEQYYCLQTITIMLKRIVTQDEITYQIEKIILKKN